MSNSWKEQIECPRCGTAQTAGVEHHEQDVFPVYVHTCIGCDYVILEGEWQRVGEPKPVDPEVTEATAFDILTKFLEAERAARREAFKVDLQKRSEKVLQIGVALLSLQCFHPQEPSPGSKQKAISKIRKVIEGEKFWRRRLWADQPKRAAKLREVNRALQALDLLPAQDPVIEIVQQSLF